MPRRNSGVKCRIDGVILLEASPHLTAKYTEFPVGTLVHYFSRVQVHKTWSILSAPFICVIKLLLCFLLYSFVCVLNAITHAIIFSSRLRTYHSRSCNENEWESRLQIRIIGVYLCVVPCLLSAFNSSFA